MLKVCRKSIPEPEGGCGGKPLEESQHFEKVFGSATVWQGKYGHTCKACKVASHRRTLEEKRRKEAEYAAWKEAEMERRIRELGAGKK